MFQTALAVTMGGAVGALIGWFGNYHVQHRIHQRFRRIDELRRSLYDFLGLVASYWAGGVHEIDARHLLEAQILAAQTTICSEYRLLAKNNKRIGRSYISTGSLRITLWDTATGGCFQQGDWEPAPERVRIAARMVVEIVKTLD